MVIKKKIKIVRGYFGVKKGNEVKIREWLSVDDVMINYKGEVKFEVKLNVYEKESM